MAAHLTWMLTGGTDNTDPDLSLGGIRSATPLGPAGANNIFDDVHWDEAAAGDVEYRALDLVNDGDAAAKIVSVWLDPNTSSADTTLDLGPDALESVKSIADESVLPAGVVFSDYGPASKCSLPNIPAGQGFRLWFRRTVQAGAANTADDGAALMWEYA